MPVGYFFDDEADTYYVRARYYDPGTGRWLAQDPMWRRRRHRAASLVASSIPGIDVGARHKEVSYEYANGPSPFPEFEDFPILPPKNKPPGVGGAPGGGDICIPRIGPCGIVTGPMGGPRPFQPPPAVRPGWGILQQPGGNPYFDVNVGGGYGLGLTGGFQTEGPGEGWHPYFGGGFTSPGANITGTAGVGGITPGWQICCQAGIPGIAVSCGWAFGPGGGPFLEGGPNIGTGGVSGSVFYVW